MNVFDRCVYRTIRTMVYVCISVSRLLSHCICEDVAVQIGEARKTRLGPAERKLQPTSRAASKHLRYVAVAAGAFHTVLLRSDGVAVASGSYKSLGLVPPPPSGVKYVDVAANLEHTLLLRSDGHVTACGPDDGSERQHIPTPQAGLDYVAIAAGAHHSVLLRSDGTMVACGHNSDGRCTVPPLPDRTCYTFVAAGLRHTVAWRSDGVAVAFGSSSLPAGNPRVQSGPCDIPHAAHAAHAMEGSGIDSWSQAGTTGATTKLTSTNRPRSCAIAPDVDFKATHCESPFAL